MTGVLIVDDEEAIREGLRHRIKALPDLALSPIDTAANGSEALAALGLHEYGLVITDMKMPSMSGIELVQRIRALAPEAKIIALSGYDDYDYVRSSFKLGVFDYLLKPVTSEDLRQHISRAISKSGIRQTLGLGQSEAIVGPGQGEAKLVLKEKDLAIIETAVTDFSVCAFRTAVDSYFSRKFLEPLAPSAIEELYQVFLKSICSRLSDREFLEMKLKKKDLASFASLEELTRFLTDFFQEARRIAKESKDEERSVMDIAMKYVQENFRQDINMAYVANMLSMNYSYFSQAFKKHSDMTFIQYVTMLRIEEAKRLLKNQLISVAEVGTSVGYLDGQAFSRAFRAAVGLSPTEYRRGGLADSQ